MPTPPLSTYLSFTRDELLNRLAHVLEALSTSIAHYHRTKSQEIRGQATFLQQADLSVGITALREQAKLSVYELTCEIQVTRAELDLLELERDFLLLLLKENIHGQS